ncbi:MAG: glycosyltransferase family 4 protein [Acidobacteria bacterium]|jgi:glycosyltransferase involved in cell wall biosynthesis|nr:glycosyltransferase family 4 protein [Acidobacteriota bacterium]
MMRVVHLDLERGWRGGQRQLLLLLEALARRGRCALVIARRGGTAAARYRSVPGTTVLEAGGRLEALRVALRLGSPKILHAHTANTTPLAVLARRRGDAALATRRLDRPATPFWLRRLDRVVAISHSVERSLVAGGVPPALIERIPSAIDRSRRLDPARRAALRASLALPENALLGLTVGAQEPQKDPLTLARAMPATPPQYHHAWVGDGALRGALERARDASGEEAARRLHLVGHDPDPDRWFGAADLFVLPSVHEGLGTVLLDAFHFGLSVIGSRIAGTAELLEDGVSALTFAPGDAAGLAAAIARLVSGPELRAALAAEGRRRVAAYDIERTAERYLELYHALTAAARR